MYRTENGYEEYPPEINTIIEQAHRKKSPTVEWAEEDHTQYSIDFKSMTEMISGDLSVKTKVKRVTKGK